MTQLIYYDGDGGGLCGHLRHRFELYLLAKLSGASVIDVYPYTRLLSTRTNSYLDRKSLQKAPLISELYSHATSFEELADRVANYNGPCILSGRHHYSSIFREYIRSIPTDRIIALYRDMFRGIGLSVDNINRITNVYRPSERDRPDLAPRLAIHLRTLIDSPSGHQQFKERRAAIYGWISQHLIKNSDPLQKDTIYIATDSSSDMLSLLSLVNHYGFKGIRGADFTHSSLVNTYGYDLLARTCDADYQRGICISQSKHNMLDWGTLRELAELSMASTIIATDSTFSQMAFVLGTCRSYHCYGYDDCGLDAFR